MEVVLTLLGICMVLAVIISTAPILLFRKFWSFRKLWSFRNLSLMEIELINDLLASNIKSTVAISIFIISSLMLIVVNLNFRNHNIENTLYIVWLIISASGLATGLVLIIQLLTESIEKSSNQRRFLTLFGCDDKTKIYSSIAIVVPAYDISPINSHQAANSYKQQAQRLVSKFSTKAAIKNDLTAASSLVLSFSKLGLPVPPIKLDQEINDNDEGSGKTYILIGLSNNVIEKLQIHIKKYFSIIRTEDQNKNLSKVIIRCGVFDNYNNLPEEESWRDYSVSLDPQTSRPQDGLEYALFAKFLIDKDIYIVCGGVSEWGTCDIGTYISDSGWRVIYTELKQEKNDHITHNEEFAIVFKLSNNEQSKSIFSIVHKALKIKIEN